MTEQYSSLASYYDRLNSHIDYENWADFLDERLKENKIRSGSLVLDLGCGTGNITLPLSSRGYDMIGVDISPEMLDLARQKNGGDKVLWLCQDMRAFELYGTVAAVVSCLDSINYLTGKVGLKKCFSLVHNYLDPNGIFIFDVNSPYKFKNIYGDRHYVMEADGVYCGWQNCFDEKSGLCDFELSIFAEDSETGLYTRFDELQRERCWSVNTLSKTLTGCGFEILSVVGGFDMSQPTDTSERLFFICRAIKRGL